MKHAIYIVRSEHGFNVIVDDRIADSLTSDEALAVAASELIGTDWPGRNWIRSIDRIRDDAAQNRKVRELNAIEEETERRVELALARRRKTHKGK